jgi:hypothetical protein
MAGHAPETDFAGSFKDFADWKVPFKDEIATIFDLDHGVKPAQVHGMPFSPGKLGAKHKSPILQSVANDFGTEAIGGCL